MMKSAERKGEEKITRRSWVDQFYVEMEQIQKRFNFYLVTTSILIFAFALVVVGGFPDGTERGTWIAFPVGILGAFLSLCFFAINYYQFRVAEIVRSKRITQPVTGEKLETGEWLREGWHAAFKYPLQAFRRTDDLMSGYTWFIPFALFLLWLVILGIRLGFYGFALIAIPAGLELWFSRQTTAPVCRRILQKSGRKIAGWFREIRVSGSTGLSVEKRALTQLGRKTVPALKMSIRSGKKMASTLMVLAKKALLRAREAFIRLFRLFSGTPVKTTLNPEDTKPTSEPGVNSGDIDQSNTGLG
jgi:hypothetical protein